MSFPTDYDSILERIQAIDPAKYASTRNFEHGAVTRLSPYISRGVISTKQVYEALKKTGLPFYTIEKLVQELAWRDYWQQVWIAKESALNTDLKNQQQPVSNNEIPTSIIQGQTGIEAVDKGIQELYETGYMHNHMRMYVAAIACNMAQSYWLQPAKWMYAHLLDGDWASNALSWQWVAGANANKKYVANQENINKYFNSRQRKTFLDRPYETFEGMDIPKVLENTSKFELMTNLPKNKELVIDSTLPTMVYTYYNLDPTWRKEESANRILVLEPSFFQKYPVSQKPLNFVLELTQNIGGIQIFNGEFSELKSLLGKEPIYFKEHPTNRHFVGTEDQRDWMFTVTGYYRSFFAFWKKCKKEIKS